jgi:hypothetical protein
VQSDAGLKKTALNEALEALASPGKSQGTDAVSSLFVDFFKVSVYYIHYTLYSTRFESNYAR